MKTGEEKRPHLGGSCPRVSVFVVCLTSVIWMTSYVSADPQWRKKPSDSRVLVGRNVTLWCEVAAVAGVGVVWQRGERILFLNHLRHNAPSSYSITGDESRGQFNLAVTGATPLDDDVYRCSVGQSSLRQPVRLTVIAAPNKTVVSVTSRSVLTAGQTASLTCSTSGANPQPHITWTRDGQLVTDGQTVTPPAVKFGETRGVLRWTLSRDDHGATFRCSVENEANRGAPYHAEILLDVTYEPLVTLETGSVVHVLEHARVTLTCHVQANPSVSSVQWFKNGARLLGTGFAIDVTNASSDAHNAIYECMAVNIAGEGRNTTTVQVIYPPKLHIPQSSAGIYLVNESSPLELFCQVDANPSPHTVTWIRAGSEVKWTGSTLSVQRVRRQDAGVYTCRATNVLAPSGGQISSGNSSLSVRIRVQYAPGEAMITQHPLREVNVGQEVTLTCSVNSPGDPAAALIWSKVGDGGFRHVGGELRFAPGTLADTGVYECWPRNALGRGAAARHQVRIREEVSFLPPLMSPQTIVNQSHDSEVHVTCTARGNPAPQITWYKDGQPIGGQASSLYDVAVTQSPVDVHSFTVKSILHFKGTARAPADYSLAVEDFGNYTCLASNKVGLDKSQTMLFVVQYVPHVNVTVSKLAVDMNHTAVLECHVRARPAPRLTWYHQSTLLTTRGRVTLLQQEMEQRHTYRGLLSIADVQWPDLGQYSCVAVNELGNGTSSVDLTVKTVPDAPSGLRVRGGTWESVALAWSPGFDGGYPQTFVIHYTSPTQTERWLRVQDLLQYNVTGLRSLTDYTFRVYAENILGASSYSNEVPMLTDDLVVPQPSSVVFDGVQNVLFFTSPSKHYCAHIMITTNKRLRHWEVYETCAPSIGGSMKLAAGAGVREINVSLCLVRRPDVCGPGVIASIAAAPPGGGSVLVLAVGSACGVLVAGLVVAMAAVLICRRRSHGSKVVKEQTNSRIYNHHNMAGSPYVIKHSASLQNEHTNTDGSAMNTMNNRPMHAAPPYSVRPNSRHNGDTHSHPVLKQDAHVTPSSPHIYQYSTDNVGNGKKSTDNVGNGKKSIPVNKSTNNAYCCDKDSRCEDNDRKAFDDVNNGNSGSQGSSMGLNSAYLAEIGLHVNHLNQKNQQSLDSAPSELNRSYFTAVPPSPHSPVEHKKKLGDSCHGDASERCPCTPDSAQPKRVVYEVVV